MSYTIVEGVAENEEVSYYPYCGTYSELENMSRGMNRCNNCNRFFYVIEDDSED